MGRVKMNVKDVLELWQNEQVTLFFHKGRLSGNLTGYLEKEHRISGGREYDVYVVRTGAAAVEFGAGNVTSVSVRNKQISVK